MNLNLHRRTCLFAGLSLLVARPADASATAAIAFIRRRYAANGRPFIDNPVSSLQCEFSLGYRAAVDLVQTLQDAGIWHVTATADGQRATLVGVRRRL